LNSQSVKSKTEKLAPAASLVSVHHLRPKTWIVGPESFETVWVGYHAYLQHGILECWHVHFKTRLESGPVTVDLTTTVVYSYRGLKSYCLSLLYLTPG